MLFQKRCSYKYCLVTKQLNIIILKGKIKLVIITYNIGLVLLTKLGFLQSRWCRNYVYIWKACKKWFDLNQTCQIKLVLFFCTSPLRCWIIFTYKTGIIPIRCSNHKTFSTVQQKWAVTVLVTHVWRAEPKFQGSSKPKAHDHTWWVEQRPTLHFCHRAFQKWSITPLVCLFRVSE